MLGIAEVKGVWYRKISWMGNFFGFWDNIKFVVCFFFL